MSVRHSKTRGLGGKTGATLFLQAQKGNRSALNHLMVQHDGLVQAILRRHGSGPLSYAEALQAGRMGLWRAIGHFDPTRRVAFSTYAWTCIMRQIWKAVNAETHSASSRLLRAQVGLPPIPAPPPLLEPDPVPSAVHDLVHRLPARLQEIVSAHYGLDGDDPANFAHIGRTLGLSEERVRQLHQEALIWLRQPAHSQQLRTLLRRHTLADYQALERLDHRWWRSGARSPCRLNSRRRSSGPTIPRFVSTCNWTALRERLPLLWPTPPDTPPSPKHRYRSHYVYRGDADLNDPRDLGTPE